MIPSKSQLKLFRIVKKGTTFNFQRWFKAKVKKLKQTLNQEKMRSKRPSNVCNEKRFKVPRENGVKTKLETFVRFVKNVSFKIRIIFISIVLLM